MTMKAFAVNKLGPLSDDSFILSDVPKPTPLPHDLLVKVLSFYLLNININISNLQVKAVSVNPVDTKVRKNVNRSLKDTLILGNSILILI